MGALEDNLIPAGRAFGKTATSFRIFAERLVKEKLITKEEAEEAYDKCNFLPMLPIYYDKERN